MNRWHELSDAHGRRQRVATALTSRGLWIGWPGGSAYFEPPRQHASEGLEQDEVHAPMTGKVVSVEVEIGSRVAEGDLLVILEAMKMEYRLTAPITGSVEAVHCEAGAQVDLGVTLVTLKPESEG